MQIQVIGYNCIFASFFSELPYYGEWWGGLYDLKLFYPGYSTWKWATGPDIQRF